MNTSVNILFLHMIVLLLTYCLRTSSHLSGTRGRISLTIISGALFVAPLVTSVADDSFFSAFVCGEQFLAIWALSVITAILVTLDKDWLFEVIIRV
jgi:hypothetical protein